MKVIIYSFATRWVEVIYENDLLRRTSPTPIEENSAKEMKMHIPRQGTSP